MKVFKNMGSIVHFLKGRSEDVIRVKPSWIWDGWLDAGMAVGCHVRRSKITCPLPTSDKSADLNWNSESGGSFVEADSSLSVWVQAEVFFPKKVWDFEQKSKSEAHVLLLSWAAGRRIAFREFSPPLQLQGEGRLR